MYEPSEALVCIGHGLPWAIPPDPSRLINLFIFGCFWVRGTLSYILNKGFAKAHAQSFKGTIGAPINRIMHFYDPPKTFKSSII